MTKAEKKAKQAYKRDLLKQGIDKEIAEVMAKTFTEYKIIKPVVNSMRQHKSSARLPGRRIRQQRLEAAKDFRGNTNGKEAIAHR